MPLQRLLLPKVSPINLPCLEALREKLILKNYSRNTQRTYYYEFAQLLYLLKDHPVDTLAPAHIKSYLLYCFENLKMTESQVQSRINAIKFYFEHVLGREKMFMDIPRPQAPLRISKWISPQEIKKIFSVVENKKHALMLKLCYGMGLRILEIMNLKMTDIDSDNMQVFIASGKVRKDRYVDLPESILEDLRDYCETCHPQQQYLFDGRGGGQYNVRSIQKIFRSAMEKANINKTVGIHSLRRSFATHLRESGADISDIQQLLGIMM